MLTALSLMMLGGPLGLAQRQPLGGAAPDLNQDGYPDQLELAAGEKARFADWFASIAESQYYGINADWKLQDQDCAGLLRYAFINALMPHNAEWKAKFKFLPMPRLPSVQGLSYPLPIIGRYVFRVARGTYKGNDIAEGRLVGRTTAQYLATFSTVRVSRNPAQAKRGDLLFFIRPNLQSYHSMVYVGRGLVVYHTGDTPADGGEVRLVSMDTLMKSAEPAFHPTPSNRNFLGVYRWKLAY